MTPEMYCESNVLRGTTRIIGTDIPDGTYTLSRKTTRAFVPLRGAVNVALDNGGFIHEDTEPPFGELLTYRFTETLDPTLRHIQTNHVTTPRFTHGVGNWVAGANRVLSVVTDPEYGPVGHVTANTNGGSQGVPGQTIAEINATGLVASTEYQITGITRYDSPDVFQWIDVRDKPTVGMAWSTLKDRSWNAIRNTHDSPEFASLYLSISVGSTNYVAPVLVRQPDIADIGKLIQFSMRVTLPVGMPAAAAVRLMHGKSPQEYAATWDISHFSMMPMSEVGPQYMYWFDGDSTIVGDPAQALFYGSQMKSYSTDYSIKWDGTAGKSTSTYTGPSRVYMETTCTIEPPEWTGGYGSSVLACVPVHLNDPVQPILGQWYGLIEISGTSYSARRELHDIIHRGPQIAVSDTRGWQSATMILLTTTLQERRMAVASFSSGRVLQFRNPDTSMPEGNEEGPWYLSIGNVQESRAFRDHRRPERLWELPFVRIEKPQGLIDSASKTGATWLQVREKNSIWDGVLSNNRDWMDVLLKEEPEDLGPIIGGDTIPGLGGSLPTIPAHAAWMTEQLPIQ